MDPEDYIYDNKPDSGKEITESVFTGRELLLATLREKCYHMAIAETITVGQGKYKTLEEYFVNKMVTRLTKCEKLYSKTGKFERDCLMKLEDVPLQFRSKVEACVEDSFAEPGNLDSENTMLAADREWALKNHIDFHPTVTINDFTYRGDIDFADIREAICAAYEKRPKNCDLDEIWKQEASMRPLKSLEAVNKGKHRNLSYLHVLGAMVSILLFNFFVWMYMQRKMRRESTDDMN